MRQGEKTRRRGRHPTFVIARAERMRRSPYRSPESEAETETEAEGESESEAGEPRRNLDFGNGCGCGVKRCEKPCSGSDSASAAASDSASYLGSEAMPLGRFAVGPGRRMKVCVTLSL